MAGTVVVTVGTRKGLFLLTSDKDRDRWETHGPFLNGADINQATIDRRTSARPSRTVARRSVGSSIVSSRSGDST